MEATIGGVYDCFQKWEAMHLCFRHLPTSPHLLASSLKDEDNTMVRNLRLLRRQLPTSEEQFLAFLNGDFEKCLAEAHFVCCISPSAWILSHCGGHNFWACSQLCRGKLQTQAILLNSRQHEIMITSLSHRGPCQGQAILTEDSLCCIGISMKLRRCTDKDLIVEPAAVKLKLRWCTDKELLPLAVAAACLLRLWLLLPWLLCL